MRNPVIRLFSSLKLTVARLLMGCVLVFWGTLAQVHLGLYKAQNEFFRSVFVYCTPNGSGLHIPIFPGGYLLGTVLRINLLCAHLRYYQPGKRKIGIVLIHFGVVLLLLGQMLTDFLSREKAPLHLRIGENAELFPKPTAPLSWPSSTPPDADSDQRSSPSPARSWCDAAR